MESLKGRFWSTAKRLCFVFALSAFVSILTNGNAFAATTTTGIITEGTARWEYSLKTDGDSQELSIMFYDKDPDSTTVTVPSLADLTDGSIPGITATLDTYFLKDADTAAQTTAYEATYPRRAATANTTKLDMSNTQKIQILGVKPIINSTVETELVFGEEMVIGDGVDISVEYTACTSWSYSSKTKKYSCNTGKVTLNRSDIEAKFPNFKEMSVEDQLAFAPTAADLGCVISGWSMNTAPVSGTCYIPQEHVNYLPKTTTTRKSEAFANYKLKLTNFGDFNYVGWGAFRNSTFNDANKIMTIDMSGLMGSDIFQNTNIEKAIIKTENVGSGLFRDCAYLTEFEFAANVSRVPNDIFAGTGITTVDFTGSSITTIGPRAFDGAAVTSVNLSGISVVEYAAFRDVHLTELLLPKSLTKLEACAFQSNTLKKLTVAYDTMQLGMALPLNVVIGPYQGWSAGSSMTVEELNVIAPYGADEAVSQTHLNYDQYRWHTNCYTAEYLDTDIRESNFQAWNPYGWDGSGYNGAMSTCTAASYSYGWVDRSEYGGKGSVVASGNLGYKFEDDYANANSYKNIIAPMYFYGFVKLKKLSIGEGYEYVGSSAFDYSWGSGTYSNANISEMSLPQSSLKGIGNLAFSHLNFDCDLPETLTFIGAGAFVYNTALDFNYDLPNVVALGDFAFAESKARNIVYHDKLKYIGNQVFEKYYDAQNRTMHDVTIDLDIFDPEIRVPGLKWNPSRTEYAGQFSFIELTSGGCYTPRFGTITFTEKVQHEFPSSYVHDYLDTHSGSNYEWFFGYGACSENDFYADKIDLSKTGWKVLPKMMTYGSFVGEFILPEHLETIAERAFNNASITEPLVIPNTVKVIGDSAFECAYTCTHEGNTGYSPYKIFTPITINSLPSSLEYIGDEAFYGMKYLTGDLNAPNLYKLGIRAFQGTGIRDVYIPEGVTSLREGTFANAPNLRNITIDNDFGAAVATANDRSASSFHAPQSVIDFYSNVEDETARNEKIWRYAVSYKLDYERYNNDSSYPVIQRNGKNFETFYTIFNKTMRVSESTDDGQKLAADQLGSVVFTENATTDIPSASGKGVFAYFQFEEFDMSQTGWIKLTEAPSSFRGVNIGTLSLPGTLKTVNERSFEEAAIGDSFTIPGTVTDIQGQAFMDTTINGDVAFENGASELTFTTTYGYSYNAFLRSQIAGTVTLPNNLKTVASQTFMEAHMGGLVIPKGIETISTNAFMRSVIGGEIDMPDTLKTIGTGAFMYSDVDIVNSFKEGLETIGMAAFIHSDFADNLVIPSTVTSIGWAAFNAGSADVHYDTVTIKPDLTAANTADQMVHQKFWGASIDKLIVDSRMLVALDKGVEGPEPAPSTQGNEEFWNMDIKEVVLNNIPKITYAAFNKCSKLEKVDLSNNTAIREIDDKAFENDEKLSTILFSPSIKNENIVLGINAFTNTGFTTIGKDGTDFNLAAAHFDATAGEVFNKMKNLKSVDVPATFSYAKVPEKTFSDAPELEEATIDYHITLMDNAAFANDNKLKRIFIWGNTTVIDENLPGYTPPTGGMGADGDEDPADAEAFGPTIPEGTDIYAYSTAPTESYAAYTGRESFDGTFYPLDEVLYLTTNKTYVKIDDNKDFDKNGLTVYGLRRDGMVVESDSWAEYDDNSYSRHDAELTFAKMEPTIEENPDFGTVWDTPVPKAELNFANVNFETIDYELVEDPEGPEGVKLINIIYTDKYTDGKPDTDVLPYTEPPIPIPVPVPDSPVTSAINIFAYIASFGAASGVLAVVIRNKLARSRR